MSEDSLIYKVISWIGVALLVGAAAVMAFRGEWVEMALLAGFVAGALLILLLEDGLPPAIYPLFVLIALINAAGWVWNLYSRIWIYDEAAHFLTSFVITLAFGYRIFKRLNECFTNNSSHYLLVVTCFGVTIGAWWEIAEWTFIERLADPVSDLILDSAGALLAAFFSLRLLQWKRATPPAPS